MAYPQHDDNLYTLADEQSPTTALFPSDLYDPMSLNIPQRLVQQRHSISASSDGQGHLTYYSSRPNSLSPSSQSVPALLGPQSDHSRSPHSSASPTSTYSISATDDFLLANPFSSTDLDMLLFQSEMNQNKSGLYLPGNLGIDTNVFANSQNPINSATFSHDESYDMFTVTPPDTRRFASNSVQPKMQPQMQMYPPYQQQWMEPQWAQPQPANNYAPRRPAPSRPQMPAPAKRPAPVKLETPAAPVVGKHNKTERRYREKVQAAQAGLRDSVPALRVLYGTSTEEQLQSIDKRQSDGTVDGLGEINRPNASAKTTIFHGARRYIEVLQTRVASLQRKVDQLEEFRVLVAGKDDLQRWQEEFAAQEALIAEHAAAQVKPEDDSFDEDDEEEEEPKRKKPKAAPKKSAKTKSKEDPNFGPGGPGGGVRVFAAFAMSFSLLPSASTLFKHSAGEATGTVFTDHATPSQILSRLPLITAEHTSRLMSRSLPLAVVPHPHTLVDWSWRMLVAVVLAFLLAPLLQRFNRKSGQASGAKAESTSRLAAAAGGASPLSLYSKWRLALQKTTDPYRLALSALSPALPSARSSRDLWQEARDLLPDDAPPALSAVLALPYDEAARCLKLATPTTSPIAAVAEQITLVHINDLLSRLFVQLVEASTKQAPNSIQVLFQNLEEQDIGAHLRSTSFDQDIRGVISGVSKGTSAHALGLVLIGLWGVFTGPTPSAQAALASALAGEELQGAGLESVSAMLDLLYPGSSSFDRTASPPLTQNALAIDKLAMVCIQYIKLLSSATRLNNQSTRLQRLEASRSVQKATSYLRLILTQTTFTGNDEETDHSFSKAQETLVGVLCVVGRRAAGRATSRDEDSGLEGDLDEL